MNFVSLGLRSRPAIAFARQSFEPSADLLCMMDQLVRQDGLRVRVAFQFQLLIDEYSEVRVVEGDGLASKIEFARALNVLATV